MARTATASVLLLLILVPVAGAFVAPDVQGTPARLLRVLDPQAPQPDHVPLPAMASGIGPGSNLEINFGDGWNYGCTANFLWQATNGKRYLGAAGHCFLPPEATATHGPGADFNANAVRVRACASSCTFGGQMSFIVSGNMVELGRVAYARQTGPGGDVGNDFGLVEIPTSVLPQTRASMPVWGGPTSGTPTDAEGSVCMYGNGVGVAEVWPTMARTGYGLGSFDDGSWQIAIASEVGDSGSAVITCSTHAGGLHGQRPVGVLTHGIGAIVATVPGVAFGTTTQKAIQMATQAGLTISVVPGA